MNNSDLITILGHLSQSLLPVERLLSGLCYLVGIAFVIQSLEKFKRIGDARARSSSSERMFTATGYLVGGTLLIFLPTTFSVLANTVFGVGNVLQYTRYNPFNIYNTMGILIQTAGLLWFFRGCVLLVHSGQPGTQHGAKGFVFLFAGILAMNFENTMEAINYIFSHVIHWTMTPH